MSVHTDLSIVAISAAPSPATSGTTLGVTDANAAYLPNVYPWWALVKPSGAKPTRANSEILKVTAGSSSGGTTTYTIERTKGLPVTTARSIIVGDDILEVLTAQQEIDVENKGGDNLLPNSNFINNSTNGYGGVTDDWTNSNGNPVQGGFPAMTKQNLIDLLGVADGDIEGFWNLNEASGNATDLSANGYTLTDTNTVTSSSDGLMALARDFEATNTEYLTNASPTNLNITGSQTFFCYIKVESLGGTLMGFRNATTADDFKALAFTGASGPTIDWNLEGLTTTPALTSDVKLETGKWYFICGVYDSANSLIKIWVNGVKKQATASGSADSNSQAFSIGRGGAYAAGGYCDGLIQNAGVLSVALTDLQVKRLFAATTYRGQKIRRATTNASLTATLTEDKVERLRGKTVTMSAKMWQEVASTGTLTVNDGSADTSTTTATTGAWVSVSVTSVISSTATSITLGLNNAVSDGNVWFKEVMLNEGSTALPWTPAPEDWVRFPRLLRMDIPAVVNGYSFEEGRWFTFTPTYSASGSMTYTSVTSHEANWLVDGYSASIQVTGEGTTGGTASTTLYISNLPVLVSSNITITWLRGATTVTDAATMGGYYFGSNTTSFATRKSDTTNFGLSTGRVCSLNISYPID
ncbi:MAG: hypothetical protein UW18_C0015G0007 [Microgenomates group bacterium GW2011_GWF1_44_10]|nr:MAG: hypothetical protein UW18_C0015G0007 [Microgenomates group bacterium GW2011_GWF1_44_10]